VKTLVLVRHGKSSWEHQDLSDRERPLKKRGHKDGKLILAQLQKYTWKNPIAISSPAKRAYDTATIICTGLQLEPIVDERLYFDGEDAIVNAIIEHGEIADSVFCFGHQPDTASLYSQLSGNFLGHIPTTGVAIIDFDIKDWSDILKVKGNSRALLFPKMFK